MSSGLSGLERKASGTMLGRKTHKAPSVMLGNIFGGGERERERERAVILICFWLVLKLEIAGSHDLTSFKIFFSDFFSQGMFENIQR